MYSFMTSHEEIKFLIKRTNYITDKIASKLVVSSPESTPWVVKSLYPILEHSWHSAMFPVGWKVHGSNCVNSLCRKVVDLVLKSFKTLGFKAHSLTKLKSRKVMSRNGMLSCWDGYLIWSKTFCQMQIDAQGPPCTPHAADNHNLNKKVYSTHLSRLAAVYTHAQFLDLSDYIYTYTRNIQKPKEFKGFSVALEQYKICNFFSLRKSLFTSPLKTDFNISM